jgi:hypothetical protein
MKYAPADISLLKNCPRELREKLRDFSYWRRRRPRKPHANIPIDNAISKVALATASHTRRRETDFF